VLYDKSLKLTLDASRNMKSGSRSDQSSTTTVLQRAGAGYLPAEPAGEARRKVDQVG
jgi:hypothetical protein